MSYRIPFQERKTAWRGLLDLASGCYPPFLFGMPVGRMLPVFHFHDVTPAYLEYYLQYLSFNGYRTVTSQAVAAFALRGEHPGPKTVVLTFDDAWLSLWTVACPLLKKYGFTAIAYVSPARVPEARSSRPTMLDPGWQGQDGTGESFASWPEIEAMQKSGTIDIQAHTLNHAVIFCDTIVNGFVSPAYRPPVHLRPLLNEPAGARYVSPDDLGSPLYQCRSRMSDAIRYLEPSEARRRCMETVRRHGGTMFFQRPDWQALLTVAAQTGTGRMETPHERRSAILDELSMSRKILTDRLPGHRVLNMCFPFSICGSTAESLLPEAGYETAFADRLFGFRAVRASGNPYRMMRLKHQYIYCLPGRHRRTFFSTGSLGGKGIGK